MQQLAGAPDKHSGTHRLLVILVLVIAAFVQLTTVSRTQVDRPLQGEAGMYFSYAWNMQEYGTYASTRTWPPMRRPASVRADNLRPPGYPLFLRTMGRVSPGPAFLRRIVFVQAGLGIVSVALLYLLGLRFLPRNWALVPAALAAISPHLAVASTYVLPEGLLSFLLLAGLLASIAAVQSRRLAWFVAAGLLWGLAELVDLAMVGFPVLLLLAAVALPSGRSIARPCLLGMVCFLAVLTPWLLRNQYGAVDPSAPDPTSTATVHVPHAQAHASLNRPRRFLSWSNSVDGDVLVYPVHSSPMYTDPVIAALRKTSQALHWPLVLLALATSLGLALPILRRTIPDSARSAAILTASLFAYEIAANVVIAAETPRHANPFRMLGFALAMLGLLQAWRSIRPGESQRADAKGHIVTSEA